LGLPRTRGGSWDTGYHREGDEWLLFPNVGIPGRTGHDYNNRWTTEGFHWYGRTGSWLTHDSIQSMLRPGVRVHLFTRTGQRDPFVYDGLVVPIRTIDVVPVEIVWRVLRPPAPPQPLAEEVVPQLYTEGATKTITVEAAERIRAARQRCLEFHGTRCVVCGVDMGERYGSAAAGFIHVHHLDPLGTAQGQRAVDPERDLRPVCPNCHGVMHLARPPYTVEQMRGMLAGACGPLRGGGYEQ